MPAALILGVVALWPALRSGFVLRYDMVFVPDPPVTWPGGGFPRAVPSDLVVALLAQVVPAAVLQKLILLGIFVLAGTGAAAVVALVRPSSEDGVARVSGRAGADPGLLVARTAAAVFYVWNAYFAQRLLLGQWALLLGYAGLPWALLAAVRGGWRRLVPALLPAAVGGFQAMLVTALLVVPVAATRPGRRWQDGSEAVEGARWPGRRVRETLRVLVVVAVLSLPWAVPALLSEAVTDPAGVDAFAARADGPFGTLGSLLSLGGIWNADAGVPGQSAWWLASVRLVVAVLAVVAFVRLREAPYRIGLLIAACAGLAVALTGAYLPGVLKTLITWWPGFGPLRDGQLYIAPLALLQAVGFAILTRRIAAPASPTYFAPSRRRSSDSAEAGKPARAGVAQPVDPGPEAAAHADGSARPGMEAVAYAGGSVGPGMEGVVHVGGPMRPGMEAAAYAGGSVGPGVEGAAYGGRWKGGWVVGVVALLVPMLGLPGLASGALGRLEAVEYPQDWGRVRAIVNGDPHPGALLSLPWGAHRAFAWNGGRVILDPATKSFARRVVWDDALLVGLGHGRVLRVAGEDPLARRVGALLRAETGPPAVGQGTTGAGPRMDGQGVGPLTESLRAVGIRYVLVVGPSENTFRSRVPGAVSVYVGPEMELLRL
ncbi:hypothetical protein ABZU32_02215 [Sphaerisporangium sp. NPDC005288]|uniref:hypothetical protein n=1 Tax=Sphaerisporangium sp. NPDC005288 TaxID=3155114 RepID=UPI0033ABC11D